MTTDTSENGLETLIVGSRTANGWLPGASDLQNASSTRHKVLAPACRAQ